MKKILGIFLALVLALSLTLVPAAVSANPGAPTIDGAISPSDEWAGATEIDVASDMGTVSVIAHTDYLYVLFEVTDLTDARDGQPVGNDKIAVNINPTPGAYDIIFQTCAAASPKLPWSGDLNSGPIDGWSATYWEIDGVQQTSLPAGIEAMTVYDDVAGTRISEWKVPLDSIEGLSAGDTLLVCGACDIDVANQGLSFKYPVGLEWFDASTHVDILVQQPSSEADATITINEDLIAISVSPSTLDFGKVYPGHDSDPQTLTIANVGSVAVDLSATTESVFYQDNLRIDEETLDIWTVPGLANKTSYDAALKVCVPSGYPAGVETGTIIFWAEEAIK